MRDSYYWTEDSFGSGPIPENWQDIVDAANAAIDDYFEDHPEDEDDDSFEAFFGADLWESFCESGVVNGVSAVYADSEPEADPEEWNEAQFSFAIREALACNDEDAYVSDMLTSSMFAPEDEDAPLPTQLIPRFQTIWEICNGNVAIIRKHTGLSQVRFAEKFLIPRRTLEDWERGISACPIYTRLLLARAVGLIE